MILGTIRKIFHISQLRLEEWLLLVSTQVRASDIPVGPWWASSYQHSR